MRKRQKLVLSCLVLIGIMVVHQIVPLEWKYLVVVLIFFMSWLFTAWSLKEGISGIEWLMIPLPPATFSMSVAMFFILLPQAIFARILILFLYGVGHYGLMLSGNIFSVSKIRTIALQRTALAIGSVLTILTGYFLFNTIWSFRLANWVLGILVGIVSFVLFLPTLWSIHIELALSRRTLIYAFFMSILMAFLAITLSFWPLNTTSVAVFLCTMFYVFLGVAQHAFEEKLYSRTVWEYVIISGIVLIAMLVTGGN